PPVAAFGDTVCSGELGFATALPGFGGQINWYDASTGGNFLHTGISFSPAPFPENLTSSPLTLTFFAEEISPDSCVSTARTPASIVILPNPDLSTADQPTGCAGEIFDLTTVNVTDANGSNGSFSFFQNPPFVPDNQINPVVQPTANTTYFIVSTATGGCMDVLAVNFVVKPSPVADIQGASALTGKICRNSQRLLTAADLGNGAPPLSFLWNNGSTNPDLTIFSNPTFGATDLYAVTITGENGCFSSDSLAVTTTTSITGVQVSTQSVSVCNGNNGSVTLTPVGGVSPFLYEWEGGGSTTLPGSLTLNGLSQGTYAFTITDSSPEGCEFYVPVVVVNGPSAIVSLENVADVSCNGGSDGCIELQVVGGNPSILWSNGFTGEVNCGLAAGTYGVTVMLSFSKNTFALSRLPFQLAVSGIAILAEWKSGFASCPCSMRRTYPLLMPAAGTLISSCCFQSTVGPTTASNAAWVSLLPRFCHQVGRSLKCFLALPTT
ncbi:MAG: SprB repeat-containing protein, partial [Bacteroidota bacterium]